MMNENVKESFEEVQMEVLLFDRADIISTSPTVPDIGEGGEEWGEL